MKKDEEMNAYKIDILEMRSKLINNYGLSL